jgi:hypothetical protein
LFELPVVELEVEPADPLASPTIWLVENNSGLPLLSVSVCPFDPVMVKYGCPFFTETDAIVPVTVDELLLVLAVPVFTVADFPISEADWRTAKLLWNAWNAWDSCA